MKGQLTLKTGSIATQIQQQESKFLSLVNAANLLSYSSLRCIDTMR